MREKVKSDARQVANNLGELGVFSSIALWSVLMVVTESRDFPPFIWLLYLMTVICTASGVVYYGRRWLASYREFMALPTAQDDPARYHIHQRWYQVMLVFGFFLILVVPGAILEEPLPLWWTTGTGMALFVVMLLGVVGSFWTQHRYLSELSPSERRSSLPGMGFTIALCWVATVCFTLALVWLTNSLEFFFPLPIVIEGQWVGSLLGSIIVLSVLYCTLWTGVYIYWQRQTPQQA
jgi:hypothetical protein